MLVILEVFILSGVIYLSKNDTERLLKPKKAREIVENVFRLHSKWVDLVKNLILSNILNRKIEII